MNAITAVMIFLLVLSVSGCFHSFQTAETIDGYALGIASTIPPFKPEGECAAILRLGKAATERSFGVEGGLQFGIFLSPLECGGCPPYTVDPLLIGNVKVQFPNRYWLDIALNVDFVPYYVPCPWNLSLLASRRIDHFFALYAEYELVSLFTALGNLDFDEIDSNVILGVEMHPFKHISLLIEGELFERDRRMGIAIVYSENGL